MPRQSVFEMPFSKVYLCLVQKAERKGRTAAEVEWMTTWLTGYPSVEAMRYRSRNKGVQIYVI